MIREGLVFDAATAFCDGEMDLLIQSRSVLPTTSIFKFKYFLNFKCWRDLLSVPLAYRGRTRTLFVYDVQDPQLGAKVINDMYGTCWPSCTCPR